MGQMGRPVTTTEKLWKQSLNSDGEQSPPPRIDTWVGTTKTKSSVVTTMQLLFFKINNRYFVCMELHSPNMLPCLQSAFPYILTTTPPPN